MFRQIVASKIDHMNFGVGSFIKDGNKAYLVIADGSLFVRLLDLDTFNTVSGTNHQVSDINHITEAEARAIVLKLGDCAFSDYNFDARGLKK